jgi:hypothetical protein
MPEPALALVDTAVPEPRRMGPVAGVGAVGDFGLLLGAATLARLAYTYDRPRS